jgi:DNA-binding MarR family transcriptional regulator
MAGDTQTESTVEPRSSWTFLTNHAHVLLCLARDPYQRQRDLSDTVGITERAAQVILGDLEQSGYLRRERVGRRNRYTLDLEMPLRRPMDTSKTVGALIELIRDEG